MTKAHPGIYKYQRILVSEPEDLVYQLTHILKDVVIGLDTETTSLSYDNQNINSIQLAGNNRVVFIPMYNEGYNDRILKTLRVAFKQMQTNNIILSIHNAPFDLAALHRIGIDWEGEVFCTMTAAHILNETRTKALKEIAHAVFGTPIQSYTDVQHLKLMDPKFIEYACLDAIFARELYPVMMSNLRKFNQDALALRIEMPFQHVLKDMRIQGLGTDCSVVVGLTEQAKTLAYELNKKCHLSADLNFTEQCDLLGNKFIQSKYNFNSSKQLLDIVENKLGIEITETTKTKNPETGKKNKSMGKKTKARLKGSCEFVKQLDLYGKVTKLLNGFLLPFNQYVDSDGRMRSSFNNTGTVTGRPSSNDPNLFNLPKDNQEIDLNFRECFVAADLKTLIAADFSGQELRGLADLTKDPGLIKCFARGMDLHLMVANEMFKLKISDDDLCEKSANYNALKDKYKKERHIAKNGVLFPLIYGSTARGISANLGISVEEAQGYIDRFFNSFPMVKKSIDATRHFINQYGYVVNKSGRRRHFDKEYGKYDDSCYRQGFNFLIQGMSADMTKAACSLIRKTLRLRGVKEAYIVLIVYDEVVIECLQDDEEVVKSIMRECMLSAYKLSVPLEVSIGSGRSYQECK